MKKIILLLLLLILFISGCQKSTNADAIKENEVMNDEEDQGATGTDLKKTEDMKDLSPIKGIWEGNLSTEAGGTFDMILDIYVDDNNQKLLVSSKTNDFYYYQVEWEMKDNHLVFSMNSEENIAVIDLSVSDENTLAGTYTQYGKVDNLTLKKTSDQAVDKAFYRIYPDYSYEERFQQLKDYSSYEEDGTIIPYTYKLNQRDEYTELINEYDLDAVTSGHEDVDLMITLLDWVCDNFNHDGTSKLPEERDAISLIDSAKSNNNAINCRGLSIILAELLRLYGIEAKHITCMPKESVFQDCHVVVHAYSKKLGQWIMLDPTYRLIMQNAKGDYVNLPMLREMLLSGEEFVANTDAGWNDNTFNVREYREYMTKNTFRFRCATDFCFGAEDKMNGNISNMLVPVNYNEDKGDITTTSLDAFWALPE